jgi:hypothetical protein
MSGSQAQVSDNHRRIIGVTLALLDEMLCQFERWIGGSHAESVLYVEHDALSDGQRRIIGEHLVSMRRVLGELRDQLDLPVRRHEVSAEIWSRASAFWENLAELGGKHLRGYGEPSPAMLAVLEPRVAQLIEALNAIVAATHAVQVEAEHA